MKKVLSLVLAAAMLVGVLAACTTLEKDENGEYDKGAIIDMYLTTECFDFDPATGFTDDAQTKIFGLIYEGLTRINENGKWEKALMKDYVVLDDADGFRIQITLNNTKWSDGRAVQANDIVYAWKRILDPDFDSEAASMLYEIKNARAVKSGDASIDDLGIASIDTLVLEIEFETKIDVDYFLETLASPALVPLREDKVVRNVNWAKKPTTMVTNGPFVIKAIEYGKSMRLERSSYYYLDSEKKEPLDKYVIPYRILINYSKTPAEQLDAFLAGDIFYDGELPLASRKDYASSAVVTDMLNTHTYFYNTNNDLFKDANVRKALSMAIDRAKIAEIATFAKPATGLVSPKVFDGSRSAEFRTVGGDLISTTADMAGAKSLLGGKTGSFTISIRANELDRAIADYVASAWTELGFTVSIRELKGKPTEDTTIYNDEYTIAYKAGDFDVIAVDMQMLSTDAFGILAPFATEFSGNGVDLTTENYTPIPHITGYSSEAYDEIIERAFEEKDRAARAAILHEAEKQLLDDMPVIPLIYLQDAYIYNSELSGIKSDYYGVRNFKRTKLNNYMAYKMETMTDTDSGSDSST